MTALLAYSILVGALLAAAAAALEGLLLRLRAPVRWIWLAALVAMVGLSLRPPRAAPVRLPAAPVDAVAAAASPAAPGSAGTIWDRLPAVAELLTAAPIRAVAGWSTPTVDAALRVGWAVGTLLLLLLGLATLLRAGASVRRWPQATVSGARVRVSPASGPAVVGLLRPQVVLPGWLLGRSAAEIELAVAHEREHVRAGDPRLLAAGLLAAVLVPWNPAAWWAVRRLRLAVEIDCDARVLRHGAARGAYGSLLIDLAGRPAELLPGAAGMAASPSILQRRLNAMTGTHSGRSLPRMALLGAVLVAAGTAACEARLPTAAEIEQMDVASVQVALADRRADEVQKIFEVDGRVVSEAEALSISSRRMEQVEFVRDAEAGTATLRIRTRNPTDAPVRIQGPDGTEVLAGELRLRGTRERLDSEPLIQIDGRAAGADRMARLRPDDIESVEILKGPAAVARFGAAAAGGAVLIRTKAGGGS